MNAHFVSSSTVWKGKGGGRDKGMDLGYSKGFRNVNIRRVQWTGQIGLRKTVLQK